MLNIHKPFGKIFVMASIVNLPRLVRCLIHLLYIRYTSMSLLLILTSIVQMGNSTKLNLLFIRRCQLCSPEIFYLLSFIPILKAIDQRLFFCAQEFTKVITCPFYSSSQSLHFFETRWTRPTPASHKLVEETGTRLLYIGSILRSYICSYVYVPPSPISWCKCFIVSENQEGVQGTCSSRLDLRLPAELHISQNTPGCLRWGYYWAPLLCCSRLQRRACR